MKPIILNGPAATEKKAEYYYAPRACKPRRNLRSLRFSFAIIHISSIINTPCTPHIIIIVFSVCKRPYTQPKDATKVPLLTTFPASWYLPEIMFAGNLIFNFFLPVK
jgi:hypothetical protein